MAKIGITGSSGMLGSHLKCLLMARKIDFLDVNRNLWDLMEWKTDKELDNIFSDTNVIIHCAAALPTSNNDEYQTIFDSNVRSCLNIAKWAVKRDIHIVFISGSTVYLNPNGTNILEEDEKVICGLGGFYGYSKLLAENIFNHFVPQGLKLTVLRPTSIYGIGLGADKLVNLFLNRAKNNETITLTEPNNKINFIHAADVSNAALSVYEKSVYGTYNIASEEMTSISDLVNLIVKKIGKGRIKLIEQNSIPFERFDLNTSLAKKEFNYKSKISMEVGIQAIINNEMLVDKFI